MLWLLVNLLEELVCGDVALGLQPVVMAQQAHELLEVLVALHLVGDHAALVGVVYAALQGSTDALLGGAGVQGVVNAHPPDGEVAVVA